MNECYNGSSNAVSGACSNCIIDKDYNDATVTADRTTLTSKLSSSTLSSTEGCTSKNFNSDEFCVHEKIDIQILSALNSITVSPNLVSDTSVYCDVPSLDISCEDVKENNFDSVSRKESSSLLLQSDEVNDSIDTYTSTSVLEWQVYKPSSKSLRTRNPIREIVDVVRSSMTTNDNQKQKPISLALGDPTAFGNLQPCSVAADAIVQAVQQNQGYSTASYIDACGTLAARQAIAHFHSYKYDKSKVDSTDLHGDGEYNTGGVTADNVIIASGCSGALEIVITSLLDNKTTASVSSKTILLVPQPGFPLYQVIAESHGGTVHHYPLLASKGWEIDINYLRTVVKQYTAAASNSDNIDTVQMVLLINNPSNPTGAVFSKQHLVDIVRFCEEYKVCIVADEVYGNIVFGPMNQFHPVAHIVTEIETNVPVITVSGLAKQFLLPGWRLGWIVFQDNKYGSLCDIQIGAKRLSQLILGASHLVQAVVPRLLTPTVAIDMTILDQWKNNLMQTLKEQAYVLYDALSSVKGLSIQTLPMGSMYLMIKINISVFDNTIQSDVDFTRFLLQEENVFVLPGSCFYPQQQQQASTTATTPEELSITNTTRITTRDNYFRVVFCAPVDVLVDASNRIRLFCQRHYRMP